MRDELIGYLKNLSNQAYQRRVWIKHVPEDNIYNDEMDYIIHFLYDDTHLGENSNATVGSILRNSEEAELVKQLIVSLDVIFAKYGINLEGADYIKVPEWAQVVTCAKNALREIR
jgi:hypothetical protein